jgi:hypothetical protein
MNVGMVCACHGAGHANKVCGLHGRRRAEYGGAAVRRAGAGTAQGHGAAGLAGNPSAPGGFALPSIATWARCSHSPTSGDMPIGDNAKCAHAKCQ